MATYRINIVGLSNNVHPFHYEFGNEFFAEYGSDIISEGDFKVDLLLDKRETFLDAGFKIDGSAKLTCDRSLDQFDFPISLDRKIVFKYGDEDEEITDEIMIINRDTAWLELGQYIYEFIVLAIPLKKLHPRFEDEEMEEDGALGKIVYSSAESGEDKNDDNDDEGTDPRWNILKKLK